jgi:hypothetical protein
MRVLKAFRGGHQDRGRPLPVTMLLLIFGAGLFIGCGQGRSQAVRVPVRGEVLLDGKPLPRGRISFNAMNGEPPATMQIQNGSYAGPAIVGRNRVMITASKSSSMKKTMGFDGPGYDESVEINMLPARYNVATELEAVVAEDVQKNSFGFELLSE